MRKTSIRITGRVTATLVSSFLKSFLRSPCTDLARPHCFSNSVANTKDKLGRRHFSVITPSPHVLRLFYSAPPFQILRPPRHFGHALMAQATVSMTGAKAAASDSVRASPAAPTPTAGAKRKRGAEQKFYAVRAGKRPGIYNTWEECLSQVSGHKGASCKVFG